MGWGALQPFNFFLKWEGIYLQKIGIYVLIGVKFPCNKGGHYPFRKSQLDSQMFGMASLMGLWNHYQVSKIWIG